MRSVSVAGALAIVVLVGAIPDSAAAYTGREDKTFTVSGKPELELSTFDGSIEVRASDRRDVQVTIERHAWSESAASEIQVDAQQNGNRISVVVREPHRVFSWGFGMSRSASLIVSVPASADIDARSGDGGITIDGVNGAIKVHSGDGAIKLDRVAGDVDASTGDGSIAVTGRLAGLRVRSGDGSVRVRAAQGSAPSGGWDVTTGDGSVVFEVASDFSGDLDAHTGDGGIDIEDVTLSDVTGRFSRNSVRGKIGSGGPLVRVRTGDGSITLRRAS